MWMANVIGCLSRVEVAPCKEFHIVHIEGKRGRKVPVLLTRAAPSPIHSLFEKQNTNAGTVFCVFHEGHESTHHGTFKRAKLWPIMGMVINASDKIPFVIGVFGGHKNLVTFWNICMFCRRVSYFRAVENLVRYWCVCTQNSQHSVWCTSPCFCNKH